MEKTPMKLGSQDWKGQSTSLTPMPCYCRQQYHVNPFITLKCHLKNSKAFCPLTPTGSSSRSSFCPSSVFMACWHAKLSALGIGGLSHSALLQTRATSGNVYFVAPQRLLRHCKKYTVHVKRFVALCQN